MSAPKSPLLIVDAMNVIGSRPDGWWRDPDAAKRRLVERLRRLARVADERIEVVIDGRPVEGLPEGEQAGMMIRYAGHSGRDAADDRIVERLADRPEDVRVVTSDRELRRRVEELGATVVGASWLLQRLDEAEARGRGDDDS